MLPCAIVACGGFAYVAWFKPHEFREYLMHFSNFFGEWDPPAALYWKSSFYFWLLRFTFLIGFLITIVIMVMVIIMNF